MNLKLDKLTKLTMCAPKQKNKSNN